MTKDKVQVLIVDDNPMNIEVIKFSLGELIQNGCSILTAMDGNEALSVINTSIPELVLLDIDLPDINGFEICKKLKREATTKDIPVIFLSGMDDIDSKLEGFKVGAIDYITKPFEKEEVCVRVKTQLRIHMLKQQVEQERKKSEDLLRSIFPVEIAQELKDTGVSLPVRYESVSVLFTDFKGFTKISEKLTPEELVSEIDFCFKAFDRITREYGVEKIKTIGDAYLCVAGLPTFSEDHATRIIMAAIEMRNFMLEVKRKRDLENKPFFEMRLGIHSGPVVAGVVGSEKFAYDIWGDTVNTAAHMESSGKAGKINISGSTYEKVKEIFHCIPRGKVEAKNKGEIDMYLVEERG